MNTPAPPVPSPEAPPAGPAAPRGRTARALDWGYRHGSALLLVPVLCLAAFTAYIPHRNYPYALHTDDWIQMANANAVIRAADVTYPDPFTGTGTVVLGDNLELGDSVFWGLFHDLSGLDWMGLLRYFPSVVFMMLVLAVFVLARKLGFGWESALFAALIPSTVGILGPAFLVPVILGMLMNCLMLYLALFRRGWPAALVIAIFVFALIVMHAPSALIFVLLVLPFALMSFKGDVRRGVSLLAAILVPFLVTLPWTHTMLGRTFAEVLTYQTLPEYVDFPIVVAAYGNIIYGLCLAGILVLVLRTSKPRLGLVLGFLLLVAMLVTFHSFHHGIAVLYERGLLYLMLMMGITAGAAIGAIASFRLPERLAALKWRRYLVRGGALAVAIGLVAATLLTTVPRRYDIPYYHLVQPADYEAFVWVRDNIGPEYERAVLTPEISTVFTAITGKYVYGRIHTVTNFEAEDAKKFLQTDFSDTDFLRNRHISILYTTRPVNNPDLVEVHPDVYLLEE